jgi:hypothetical protein
MINTFRIVVGKLKERYHAGNIFVYREVLLKINEGHGNR